MPEILHNGHHIHIRTWHKSRFQTIRDFMGTTKNIKKRNFYTPKTKARVNNVTNHVTDISPLCPENE